MAARPLSTTVSRYQRLHLSRRRGNAVRAGLVAGGLVRAVPLATRSGQVVLYELTEEGRAVCDKHGIDPGAPSRESLKHGYEVSREHVIKSNGAVDLLAEKPGQRVAVEIETGKSDIEANTEKTAQAGFDGVVLVATSPGAAVACTRLAGGAEVSGQIEILTWLDVS